MYSPKNLIKLLAADIGAGSGRVVGASFDGSKLEMEEVYRFPNGYVNLNGSLHWDFLLLWNEVKKGLGLGLYKNGGTADSISVDAWGADFCLFDGDGHLLGNPFHYRDSRTAGIIRDISGAVLPERIFEITGNQLGEISTLSQLFSMKKTGPHMLGIANDLLPIANAFIYLLSGHKTADFTTATGTALFDWENSEWSAEILDKCALNRKMLPDVAPCGTVAGRISNIASSEIGGHDSLIINSGGHDTALAAMSVPTVQEEYLYINSGTWSVMGTTAGSPVTADKAFRIGLTNFGIPSGKYTLCKIFSGLWILQECRRAWQTGGESLDYNTIFSMAEKELPHRCFLDVEDPVFIKAGDMPSRISEYCADRGFEAPQTAGATALCILESIAFKYREVLEEIEQITGKRYETIHIVGGGSLNSIICRFTANVCGRNVIAGPAEATVLGNVFMQLSALGEAKDRRQFTGIIENSIPVKNYLPECRDEFEEAFSRYKKLIAKREV